MTPDQIKEAKFRGPVRFYDGRNGMAQQDFECVDEPRLSYAWRRENKADKGRQYYMVDGTEVADIEEAATLLAKPTDPNSPDELWRKDHEEFRFSPRIGAATRALSEARCNGDALAFGTVRAWMRRASNPWHGGINAFADQERKAEREWPSWLYTVKSAAHETSRGMYLFMRDAEQDTGLQCALGKKCRNCPILKNIERSMQESRTREVFPSDVEDSDIAAAKIWTCIGHILTTNERVVDGVFFSTEEDRNDTGMW